MSKHQKIYRIRRKSDGRFFTSASSTPYSLEGNWTNTGVFFYKAETVKRHLINLCTYRVYVGHGYDHKVSRDKPARNLKKGDHFGIWPAGTPVRQVAILWGRLELYEVIVTDITINNEDKIDAAAFGNINLFKEGCENV